MVEKRTLLWLGEGPAPVSLGAALGADWTVEVCDYAERVGARMEKAALVAVAPNGLADDPVWLDAVLRELEGTSAVGVFLLPEDARLAWSLLRGRAGNFLAIPDSVSHEELAGRLAAAGALQTSIANLRSELAAGESARAAERKDLEEEMQLASRLQRDFLPKQLPEVGPVRFDVLYRPASWVSGDIYDILRLDETHVGFYIADVVGHGMPAALLTMFIKKAMLTKRIEGRRYEIIEPGTSLTALNLDICEQHLSSCQFCTAVYCIVDAGDLTVTFSRAGHPEPIILHADGSAELCAMPGSLLGVFPEEKFQTRQVRLAPGDRLILYSDGAERGLLGQHRGADEQVKVAVAHFAGVPRQTMLAEISSRIEAARAVDGLTDDATVLVMDVQ